MQVQEIFGYSPNGFALQRIIQFFSAPFVFCLIPQEPRNFLPYFITREFIIFPKLFFHIYFLFVQFWIFWNEEKLPQKINCLQANFLNSFSAS